MAQSRETQPRRPIALLYVTGSPQRLHRLLNLSSIMKGPFTKPHVKAHAEVFEIPSVERKEVILRKS